eukprot:8795359-Heterocapsa_arctica.AAC.1
MARLPGWAQNQGTAPEDINAMAENHRLRLDSSTQWRKSGAVVWDGIQDPCGCGAFVFAHYHDKGGGHKEGDRCPPDQA